MNQKIEQRLRALAMRACQMTSFEPERRGEQLLAECETGLQTFLSRIPEDVRNDAYYTDTYIQKYGEWLGAMSRCFSVMITGAGGFNNRRHEKANQAEQNARQRLDDWCDRIIKRTNRQTRLRGWDEVERLQAKLDERTDLQERMKTANKIVLNKKWDDDTKWNELLAAGFSEALTRQIMTPDFVGRVGFASYQLSNNNAEIRRLQSQIDAKVKNLGKADETRDYPFGQVEIAYSCERIKIRFNEIPPAPVRDICKANAYHWSRTEGVWMRQITPNALFNLERHFIAALCAEYPEQ